MYVDQWQSGPAVDFSSTPAIDPMESGDVALLSRMDAYLARLPFDDAQRLWLRAELALQLRQLPMDDPANRSARAFAILQNRIATLHRGDEWEARLALVMRPILPLETEQPSRWLRTQQLQPRRKSMGSAPMQRSLGAFLQRQTLALRSLWNRGLRLVPFLGNAR